MGERCRHARIPIDFLRRLSGSLNLTVLCLDGLDVMSSSLPVCRPVKAGFQCGMTRVRAEGVSLKRRGMDGVVGAAWTGG